MTVNTYVAPSEAGSGIGGRDIKYFCRQYPISHIDIALSDIGKIFVGLKAFSPISDQSDNETA
jgi:hypothetical protein